MFLFYETQFKLFGKLIFTTNYSVNITEKRLQTVYIIINFSFAHYELWYIQLMFQYLHKILQFLKTIKQLLSRLLHINEILKIHNCFPLSHFWSIRFFSLCNETIDHKSPMYRISVSGASLELRLFQSLVDAFSSWLWSRVLSPWYLDTSRTAINSRLSCPTTATLFPASNSSVYPWLTRSWFSETWAAGSFCCENPTKTSSPGVIYAPPPEHHVSPQYPWYLRPCLSPRPHPAPQLPLAQPRGLTLSFHLLILERMSSALMTVSWNSMTIVGRKTVLFQHQSYRLEQVLLFSRYRYP